MKKEPRNRKPNMGLVDKTVSINRSIATVFEFLSNHENYIRWFPQVVAIQAVDNLPHGTVGKIYQETLRLPTGRNQKITIKVVESRSPDLFITEGTFAPVHPRMEIRLSATSAQETAVSLKFFSRSQSSVGRFLIATFVRKVFVRQSDIGLRQLKNVLEGRIR
jgi:hypothetical protein